MLLRDKSAASQSRPEYVFAVPRCTMPNWRASRGEVLALAAKSVAMKVVNCVFMVSDRNSIFVQRFREVKKISFEVKLMTGAATTFCFYFAMVNLSIHIY